MDETTYAVTPPAGGTAPWRSIPRQPGPHAHFQKRGKVRFSGGKRRQPQDHAGQDRQACEHQRPLWREPLFPYTGSNLTSIADNLGVSGRSGLTLTYSGSLLHSIADWTGRAWTFAYDSNSNLASVTNPMGKITSYTYTGDP